MLDQLIEDTSLGAVQRMQAIFESETIKRVEIMLALIDDGNWNELKKEAHTLKSSAASYGALSLSALAESIESDITKEDEETLQSQTENYRNLAKLSEASLKELRMLLEAQDA